MTQQDSLVSGLPVRGEHKAAVASQVGDASVAQPVKVFGGFLAGKAALSRRFFWGMLTGILYFAVLFAISWLMNRQTVPVPDLTRAATVLACCAVGGTAGGMFS